MAQKLTTDEVLDQLHDLMVLTNSYECDFDLIGMGYKSDKTYTNDMPLGTHCYSATIEIDGLRKHIYGDTLMEVIKIIVWMINKHRKEKGGKDGSE